MIKKICFVIVVHLLCVHNIFSQGIPLIQNFTPTIYAAHPQNWGVTQGKNGILYFANNSGVLYNNGIIWSGDIIKNNNPVNCIEIGNDGVVYVGSHNEFGMMVPNDKGHIIYESLSDKLPEKLRNFKSIWSIFNNGNEVIFFSNECIFSFKNNNFTATFPTTTSTFHKMFKVGNKFIVRQKGSGLFYYSHNNLQPIINTELFAEEKADFIFDCKSHLLIGTRNSGLYKYDYTEQKLSAFECEASEKLKGQEVYHATLLHDKTIAIATKISGIYFIAEDGKLLDNITKEKNLINNCVYFVYEDMHQNIWAATDNGISQISYFLPFRVNNETNNLLGNVNAVCMFEKKLFVGTSQKIYLQKEDKFKELYIGYCNAITPFKVGNEKLLLFGAKKGLLRLINEQIENAELNNSEIELFSLLQSSYNKNLLYAGCKNQFLIFEYKNGVFELTQNLEINGDARSLLEDKEGNVFIGIENFGIVTFNIHNLKANNFTEIVSAIDVSIVGKTGNKNRFNIENFNNKILVATNSGFWKLEKNKNKPSVQSKIFDLKQENIFDNQIDISNGDVFKTYMDATNHLWVQMSANGINLLGYYTKNTTGGYSFNNYHFRIFPNMQTNGFFVEPYKYCWLATNDGLVRYDFRKPTSANKKFYSIIHKITDKNNKAIFDGFHSQKIDNKNVISIRQADNAIPIIEYNNNDLNFEFSATSFINKEQILFRTYLKNFDDKKTDWSHNNKRTFTNIYEGTYTFYVFSKDVYGNLSEPTSYTFTIKAPWYRTIWAYIVYILIAYFIIREIVKYNTKRLKAQNILLEEKVKQRTFEIELKNEQLEKSKTEIETQNIELEKSKTEIEIRNTEITDSINYAKIIQTAILPQPQNIVDYFENKAFVYFRPRDVVSGDFYWFTNVDDKCYISAADCTGHGVPGAFMSMIGMEKLNQAVREVLPLNVSNILSFVNVGVKKSLGQTQKYNKSKDGMEMALCEIDYKNKIVQYAGANRPLWIFRKSEDGTFENLVSKPTKAGIGGDTESQQIFEQHSLHLQNNDTLYLFSDGVPDQFGGERGKKLMTTGLREMLSNIQGKTMVEQGKYIQQFYIDWMGELEQVDDILIIGIRF